VDQPGTGGSTASPAPLDLTKAQRRLAWGLMVVAAGGWAGSAYRLTQFASRPPEYDAAGKLVVDGMNMGWAGASVFIIYDGLALILTVSSMYASLQGHRTTFRTLLVLVAAGVSAWIGYHETPGELGKGLAAGMPVAAVIVFEVLMFDKRRQLRPSGRPRIHPLRWVFDRKGTLDLYKAYVLHIRMPEHLEQARITVEAERLEAAEAESARPRTKKRRQIDPARPATKPRAEISPAPPAASEPPSPPKAEPDTVVLPPVTVPTADRDAQVVQLVRRPAEADVDEPEIQLDLGSIPGLPATEKAQAVGRAWVELEVLYRLGHRPRPPAQLKVDERAGTKGYCKQVIDRDWMTNIGDDLATQALASLEAGADQQVGT